jgi:DNA-directed RNA polymerase specialized sigma24 family protein
MLHAGFLRTIFPSRTSLAMPLEKAMSSMDPYQLAPLLQRSVAGDACAWNDLLTRLRPYVHAQMLSRLGPDPVGGLDKSCLVQRSLLRIHQGFGQLRNHEVPVLLAWVRQIARNVVTDALRAFGRKPALRRGFHVLATLRSKELSPAQQLERAEVAVRVARLLQELPERQRRGPPASPTRWRAGRSTVHWLARPWEHLAWGQPRPPPVISAKSRGKT